MTELADVDWHREAERGCEGKRRYGQRTARLVAERRRAGGDRVSAYRCPWCRRAWHVGHVPSLEALERIAAAIRARMQDPAA